MAAKGRTTPRVLGAFLGVHGLRVAGVEGFGEGGCVRGGKRMPVCLFALAPFDRLRANGLVMLPLPLRVSLSNHNERASYRLAHLLSQTAGESYNVGTLLNKGGAGLGRFQLSDPAG